MRVSVQNKNSKSWIYWFVGALLFDVFLVWFDGYSRWTSFYILVLLLFLLCPLLMAIAMRKAGMTWGNASIVGGLNLVITLIVGINWQSREEKQNHEYLRCLASVSNIRIRYNKWSADLVVEYASSGYGLIKGKFKGEFVEKSVNGLPRYHDNSKVPLKVSDSKFKVGDRLLATIHINSLNFGAYTKKADSSTIAKYAVPKYLYRGEEHELDYFYSFRKLGKDTAIGIAYMAVCENDSILCFNDIWGNLHRIHNKFGIKADTIVVYTMIENPDKKWLIAPVDKSTPKALQYIDSTYSYYSGGVVFKKSEVEETYPECAKKMKKYIEAGSE